MDYLECDIKCPYFGYLKSCKIKCEAVNDLSKKICIEFASNKKRNEYIENFCACGCWRGCPIVEVIEKMND